MIGACACLGLRGVDDKTLYRGSVDSVFGHPSEMQIDGAEMLRRIQRNALPVRAPEIGLTERVGWILRHIRHQFHPQVRGVGNVASEPMDPRCISCEIAGTAEPTLVSCNDLSRKTARRVRAIIRFVRRTTLAARR